MDPETRTDAGYDYDLVLEQHATILPVAPAS
jgi:hypothetical protein